MPGVLQSNARVLADVEDAGERRRVRLIEGESLALVEESSGPLTQLAYESDMFGHKMLFEGRDAAQALGVDEDRVVGSLVEFFAADEEPPLLSDVMDRFDRTGAPYSYMSWSGDGDSVFRAASASGA